MSKDYEPLIRARKPRITWKDCNYDACRLGTLISEKGTVTVPHSYDHDTGKTIEISFQRFRHPSSTASPIKRIVIQLAGGPGSTGRSKDETIKSMFHFYPNEGIAGITIDHRGLGESAPFEPLVASLMHTLKVASQVPHLPFPIKDLTTHNAALDVVSLAIALLGEVDNDPNVKVFIHGTSYGAAWGNIATGLAPNLFEASFLGSPPLTKGQRSDGRGVAEACALDDFCRSKIGGNVLEEYRRAIKRIVAYDTNACTRALGDHIEYFPGSTIDKRLYLLNSLFMPLITNKSSSILGPNTMSQQLLVPFVKATSDCIDPDAYIKQILPSMGPFFLTRRVKKFTAKADTIVTKTTAKEWDQLEEEEGELFIPTMEDLEEIAQGEGSKLSNWVNRLGFIDLMAKDGLPNNIPPNFDDIHQDIVWPNSFAKPYKLLSPHLKDKLWTDNVPLQSEKTRVFVVHGRLDLNCTYEAAYNTAVGMRAAEVQWILMEHVGHNNIPKSKCWAIIMGMFLDIPNKFGGLEECLKQANQSSKLNWTFKNHPQLVKIWDYVKPCKEAAHPIAKQVSNVPSYQIFTKEHQVARRPNFDSKNEGVDNIYLWIGLIIGSVMFVSLVGFLIWRWHRRSLRRVTDKLDEA